MVGEMGCDEVKKKVVRICFYRFLQINSSRMVQKRDVYL